MSEQMERGTLEWTVDLPALIKELITNDANLKNIGPGAAYGFAIALMYLSNIGILAIRDDHKEILAELEKLGIIRNEREGEG